MSKKALLAVFAQIVIISLVFAPGPDSLDFHELKGALENPEEKLDMSPDLKGALSIALCSFSKHPRPALVIGMSSNYNSKGICAFAKIGFVKDCPDIKSCKGNLSSVMQALGLAQEIVKFNRIEFKVADFLTKTEDTEDSDAEEIFKMDFKESLVLSWENVLRIARVVGLLQLMEQSEQPLLPISVSRQSL